MSCCASSSYLHLLTRWSVYTHAFTNKHFALLDYNSLNLNLKRLYLLKIQLPWQKSPLNHTKKSKHYKSTAKFVFYNNISRVFFLLFCFFQEFLCLIVGAMNPGLCDWVASLLNSAAVVFWRHLGNRGNWWTYPVTIAASETAAESKLIWAPLCSLICGTASGQRPGFTTF